jgi:hypothetical protein
MIRAISGAVFAAIALIACGSKETAEPEREYGAASTNPALASLPATVEGALDMTLGEGTEEEDGSDVAFGSLVVGKEELYIQVASKLLDATGLPPDGGKVRATISSKEDLGDDMTQYRITALEKL